jgi:hypothetical protein
MQPLKLVLIFKILLTFALWSLPLLLFPTGWLIAIGFPDPGDSIAFVRLLGAAYLSLGVGYVLGDRDLEKEKDISNVVTVGIVSNGLAGIILLIFGVLGKWQGWGIWAQAFMWGSAIATGLISTGLIVFMPKSTKMNKEVSK